MLQNVIDDAMRSANVQGDGRAPEGSIGVWPAATNRAVNTNGEAGVITGWSTSGATLSVPNDGEKKFGTRSFLVETVGSTSGDGMLTTPSYRPAAAQGEHWVASAWVKGQPGASLRITILEYDAAGTLITAAATDAIFTATGDWQYVDVRRTLSSASVATVQMRVRTSGTQVTSFRVGGTMFERNTTATMPPSPYIPNDSTTAGTTATRAAGRMRAQASLTRADGTLRPFLTSRQGWLALRVRMGFAATDDPHAGSSPRMFEWQDTSGNVDGIRLRYDVSLDRFRLEMLENNTTSGLADVLGPIETFARDTVKTIIVFWTATDAGISIDGAAPTRVSPGSKTKASTPIEQTFMDIGSSNSGTAQAASTFLWAIVGEGVLSTADMAALHALPNGSESLANLMHGSTLSDGARPTAVYPMNDATYLIEQERQLTVRAFEPPQFRGSFPKEFRVAMVAGTPPVSTVVYTRSTTAAPWQVQVTNEGDREMFPLVYFQGASGAPITVVDVRNNNTGEFVRINQNSPSIGTSSAFVDMAAERVYGSASLNNVDLAVSKFWSLAPGETTVVSLTSLSGTPTQLHVEFRHAYV